MIHLFGALMMAARAPVIPPAENALLVSFSGGETSAIIGVGDSIDVEVVYANPGQETDYIDMFVAFFPVVPPSGSVQWGPLFPASVDAYTGAGTFSPSSFGYHNAGTYVFTASARRLLSSQFDVISNSITLTIA